MIIHVVLQGETISSIAQFYGKSTERLALENGINPDENLVVGETLVILFPEIEYTVGMGDTIEGIARYYNTSVMALLRNNPYLSDRQYIYPGEVIVINYRGYKMGKISTNGLAYPFINLDILKKTLPFLTYVTVYGYFYNVQGNIVDIDDTAIIKASKAYGVAPVMMLAALSSIQEEEMEITHNMLINQDVQDILISNLISILTTKGYYGVNFKTPFIRYEDRLLFNDFIEKLSEQLHSAGFKVFITLTVGAFDLLSNVQYGKINFESLGRQADRIIFLTYERGFLFGISANVVAFDTFNINIEYIVSKIPKEKIEMGLSTIGYIWRLPYIVNKTSGQAISYESAIALARENNVEIKYDEVAKSSYYQYFAQYEYIVRFRDARGVDSIVGLVPTHGISGMAIWNIMFFYNQMWLVINSQYEIEKLTLQP